MIPFFPKIQLILISVCLLSLARIATANPDEKSAPNPLPPPPGSDMPVFELGAGYSYMRVNDGVVDNLNGFDLSAFVNLRSWLALGGEFIGGFGKDHKNFFPTGRAATTEDRFVYAFGPRFGFAPVDKVRVFGQVMLGGATLHATAHYPFRFLDRTADEDAFVVSLGGGVDWKLTQLLTWRVLEADYMRLRFGGDWEGDLQLSTALVFTFGH
jgi:hypothetical protein